MLGPARLVIHVWGVMLGPARLVIHVWGVMLGPASVVQVSYTCVGGYVRPSQCSTG